jgi:chromosome segregation protein
VDVAIIIQELESQKTAQALATQTHEQMRTRAAALASALGDKLHELRLSPPVDFNASTCVTLVERAHKQVADALSFATTIAHEITLVDTQSFETVQVAVDEAVVAFDKASHAAQADSQAQSELKKKASESEHVRTTLERESKAQRNFEKANEALSQLFREYSLDRATKDALTSIRGRVIDVFSRIHSPQEYKLGDFEHNNFLVTRETNEPHGIDRVSTGQRAAFALSIFLALNGSASSAPPVILIDDPVAHIDDLNALSFLDYLRDLVMSSSKQVFFATADARLAALFQRKFEFLGQERFRKIVLSR